MTVVACELCGREDGPFVEIKRGKDGLHDILRTYDPEDYPDHPPSDCLPKIACKRCSLSHIEMRPLQKTAPRNAPDSDEAA